jgi:hypothetical protein
MPMEMDGCCAAPDPNMTALRLAAATVLQAACMRALKRDRDRSDPEEELVGQVKRMRLSPDDDDYGLMGGSMNATVAPPNTPFLSPQGGFTHGDPNGPNAVPPPRNSRRRSSGSGSQPPKPQRLYDPDEEVRLFDIAGLNLCLAPPGPPSAGSVVIGSSQLNLCLAPLPVGESSQSPGLMALDRQAAPPLVLSEIPAATDSMDMGGPDGGPDSPALSPGIH